MSELNRLYFGRDDAESDFAEGGLLRAGFLKTMAFDAALKGKKHLIIGRKGSGKSAICMTLAANNNGLVTSLVTPDAMSLDEIRRFELQGLPDYRAKSLFWRYMLDIQIAKYVVAHAASDHRKTTPDSVNKVRKFLVGNNEGIDPSIHEKFWRSIQRLRSLSLGAFTVNVAIEVDAPSEGLQTSGKLEVIERSVKAALSDLACPPEHPRFLLLVDQLEQVWSNDPESDAMVTGLLMATKHASSTFPGIRCVVFLRTDIYDLLQFAEGDKFHGDEMRIDWNPVSLLDLARARASVSLGHAVSAADLWNGLFSSHVVNKPVSEYIMARTLMRPRDLIQFANLCRDTAEKNGHIVVSEPDVLEAEVQYSQWKLHDLATEYSVNYPFLADLFMSFQNSGFIISRQSLEERFSARLQTLRSRFPELAASLTIDGIIDILYGIGFLGVRRKLKTVYSYEDPARVEPSECQFYIHPGFRQALRSVTAADLHPYFIPAVFEEAEILQNVIRIGPPEVRGGYQYSRRSSIERSTRRILSLLDDPQLAPEIAAEIRAPIQEMLTYSGDVGMRLDAGLIPETEMNSYIRRTCNFLLNLATELQAGGIGDDLVIRRVARTMEDEARRLAEEAGIRI